MSKALPLAQVVDNLPEIILTVFTLHIHKDAVGARLNWNMKERVDPWMIEQFGNLLQQTTEGVQMI